MATLSGVILAPTKREKFASTTSHPYVPINKPRERLGCSSKELSHSKQKYDFRHNQHPSCVYGPYDNRGSHTY